MYIYIYIDTNIYIYTKYNFEETVVECRIVNG